MGGPSAAQAQQPTAMRGSNVLGQSGAVAGPAPGSVPRSAMQAGAKPTIGDVASTVLQQTIVPNNTVTYDIDKKALELPPAGRSIAQSMGITPKPAEEEEGARHTPAPMRRTLEVQMNDLMRPRNGGSVILRHNVPLN